MPSAVYTLWTILLVVTVLLLPFIVYLLHTTLKAARSIERYMKEMKVAGLGIAGNTAHIEALNDTISVASGMLEVASDVNIHIETIKNTLAGRAVEIK